MKNLPNYAFIDSQNLNLGVRSQGWRIDYRKLGLYLKNKYRIEKAFLFIGLVANNQKLYTELQSAGFILIFKPTVRYFENGVETVKGNVDAELVLHAAAVQYPHYDKAIIVSGDGDFACLVEFLLERDKLLKLLTPNAKYSKLLAQFDQYIVRVDKLVASFGFKPRKTKNKKDQDWRSVETLGSLGHDDGRSIAEADGVVNKKKRPPIKTKNHKGSSRGDTSAIVVTKQGVVNEDKDKRDQHRRSVETLGLSGHGSNSIPKVNKPINNKRKP